MRQRFGCRALTAAGAATSRTPAGDELDDVDEPVAIGAEHEMLGTRGADRTGDRVLALPGRGFVTIPQRRGIGLHVEPAAGLGVDERRDPDRGQGELARIDGLDRDAPDGSPRGGASGLAQSLVVEEVGDHDDLAPTGPGSLERRAARR